MKHPYQDTLTLFIKDLEAKHLEFDKISTQYSLELINNFVDKFDALSERIWKAAFMSREILCKINYQKDLLQEIAAGRTIHLNRDHLYLLERDVNHMDPIYVNDIESTDERQTTHVLQTCHKTSELYIALMMSQIHMSCSNMLDNMTEIWKAACYVELSKLYRNIYDNYKE